MMTRLKQPERRLLDAWHNAGMSASVDVHSTAGRMASLVWAVRNGKPDRTARVAAAPAR